MLTDSAPSESTHDEVSERRRQQLRDADRRRHAKHRAARLARLRAYAKNRYSTERQREKTAARRANAAAAFRDWLRAERVKELRRSFKRTRLAVEFDVAQAAYQEWFEALDDPEVDPLG